MNHLANRLYFVAKVLLTVPPLILFLIGIAIRFKMHTGDIIALNRFLELVLGLLLYLTPLLGVIILIATLFIRKRRREELLSQMFKNLLIFSILIIISPIWLFLLWLLISGFNR